MGYTVPLEIQLKKAKLLHKDAYDYSLIKDYIDTTQKVPIICKIEGHGIFITTLASHLHGRITGCPKCGQLTRNKKMLPYAQAKRKKFKDSFLERANKVHNFRYSYTMESMVGSHEKMEIVCEDHGKFYQTPWNHLSGQNCPDCNLLLKQEFQKERSRIAGTKFISRAKKVHGNLYDYSETFYTNAEEKVKVICPKEGHGAFYVRPMNHLAGNGCPVCNYSKMELFLEKLFNQQNITIEREFIFNDLNGLGGKSLRFDFAIYNQSVLLFLLEFQGAQHFKPWANYQRRGYDEFEYLKNHDKRKVEYCKSQNIPLEFINYDQDVEERFYLLLNKYEL